MVLKMRLLQLFKNKYQNAMGDFISLWYIILNAPI